MGRSTSPSISEGHRPICPHSIRQNAKKFRQARCLRLQADAPVKEYRQNKV